MNEIEVEILKRIKLYYEDLKKYSDIRYEYKASKRLEFPADSERFTKTFDLLYHFVVNLKLFTDNINLQAIGTLKSKEVKSLSNITLSQSKRETEKNNTQAIADMKNIVDRLAKFELSEILKMIEEIDAKK